MIQFNGMNIGTAQIGLVKGAADRLDDLISGIVVFAADKLGRKGGAGKDRIRAKLCLQNIDAVKNFIHGVGNILQNDLVLRSGVRNGLSGRCLRQKLIEKCHGQSKNDNKEHHALRYDAVSKRVYPEFPFFRHVTILP